MLVTPVESFTLMAQVPAQGRRLDQEQGQGPQSGAGGKDRDHDVPWAPLEELEVW